MSLIRKLFLPKPPVLGRWNSVIYSKNRDKFSDQGNYDYCYSNSNPKIHTCEPPLLIKILTKLVKQK